MSKTRGRTKKPFRRDMTLMEAVQKFSTEEAAEEWFISKRWRNGVICPHCESSNIAVIPNRKPMPFRCRDCRKHFSVRTGSVFQSSKLPMSKWAIGIFLMSTRTKGVSSLQLARDLGITQKSAWHMAHRIRECWDTIQAMFDGPCEADETYVGGRSKNKHKWKRLRGRGTVGKTPVAGVKDRVTNQVSAAVVKGTDRPTLLAFLKLRVVAGATLYTDEWPAYAKTPYDHHSVQHSSGQYVDGDIHTNGIESFWAVLKRMILGVYHHVSPKHLFRYVREVEARQNARPLDTEERMSAMAVGAVGRRLRYADLTAGR